MDNLRTKNSVCLFIDRLHLGFLGAYGTDWIHTPVFDELAGRSVLFDRYYTDSLDIRNIYARFWKDGFPQMLSDKGVRTVLLSDDSDVTLHPDAQGFSDVHLIDLPQPLAPHRKIEDTRFFRILADLASILGELDKSQPYFLWAHLRGFEAPWDFPYELRKTYREEDDPEPYPLTSVPSIDQRNEEDPDPDVVRAVLEAYAGGIGLLELALGGFLESLPTKDRPFFVFGGTRGFPMGEHGIIGLGDHVQDVGSMLWEENLHLPLLLNFPENEYASVRSSGLCIPEDVNATLWEWFSCERKKSLFPLIREENETHRNKIVIDESKDITAMITPEWFLRVHQQVSSPKYELFVKPDDRFEVNEVSSRCETEIEQILTTERDA